MVTSGHLWPSGSTEVFMSGTNGNSLCLHWLYASVLLERRRRLLSVYSCECAFQLIQVKGNKLWGMKSWSLCDIVKMFSRSEAFGQNGHHWLFIFCIAVFSLSFSHVFDVCNMLEDHSATRISLQTLPEECCMCKDALHYTLTNTWLQRLVFAFFPRLNILFPPMQLSCWHTHTVRVCVTDTLCPSVFHSAYRG